MRTTEKEALNLRGLICKVHNNDKDGAAVLRCGKSCALRLHSITPM